MVATTKVDKPTATTRRFLGRDGITRLPSLVNPRARCTTVIAFIFVENARAGHPPMTRRAILVAHQPQSRLARVESPFLHRGPIGLALCTPSRTLSGLLVDCCCCSLLRWPSWALLSRDGTVPDRSGNSILLQISSSQRFAIQEWQKPGISSCDTSLASSTLPIKGLRRLDGPCTLGMYTTVPPNMPSFSCLVPLTF